MLRNEGARSRNGSIFQRWFSVLYKRKKELPPLSMRANIIWNSVGSMVFLACQWLTTVLVVRLSDGYGAAGLLSLVMSVVGTFSTFAMYKMGTYQVSDVKRENSSNEYLGFRFVTLVLAFGGCVVYSLVTCPLDALPAIVLYFIYKAIGLVIDIFHGIDQVHRRMDIIGKSFILQGIFSIVFFAVVFGATQSLEWAIAAMAFSSLIVLFAYDLPRSRLFGDFGRRITVSKTIYLLKRSFSAVLAALAGSAISTVPKQLLLIALGDAALGIYSSVAAPALIVQMGATYLYAPMLSVFPECYLKGDKLSFVRLLARTVVGILLVSIAASILLALIGEWVLCLLFGDSIAPYTYLIQPVVVASAATAFLWFFGDLLITLRSFRGNFVGNVVALILVVPLSVACIYLWGMNGASIATAAACLVGSLIMAAYLARAIQSIPREDADETAEVVERRMSEGEGESA